MIRHGSRCPTPETRGADACRGWRWEHIACISFRCMDNVNDLQMASSQRHPCSPLNSMIDYRNAVWGIFGRGLSRRSAAVLRCKTSHLQCLALHARVLVASRLLQRTQKAVVSIPTPGCAFQTRVPDRQGPSRDFQIRAALSLRGRGCATMLAKMLAATVTSIHRCACLLLCSLRFKDIKRPMNRVRRPRLASSQCFIACRLILPALACLALFAFVRWADSRQG